MEARPQTPMSRWLTELRYRFLGPTLVHLQYEFYLLCSAMLLTVGSMRGLYKDSFGTRLGDYKFLLVMLLVLGRHLVLRILCTWDPSTHASPSIMGLLSHFVQSHIYGGQTFDRPPPPMQQQLFQQTHAIHQHSTGGSGGGNASNSSNVASAAISGAVVGGGAASGTAASLATTPLPPPPSAADRLNQMVGGVLETREATSWSQLTPSFIGYAWQLPRRYLWFPLSRLLFMPSPATPSPSSFGQFRLDGNSGGSGDDNTRQRSIRGMAGMGSVGGGGGAMADVSSIGWQLRRTFHLFQQYTIQPWILHYAFSLHCIIAVTVAAYYCEVIWLCSVGRTPLSLIFGNIDGLKSLQLSSLTLTSIYPVQSQVSLNNSERGAEKLVGNYDRQIEPTALDLVLVLLGFGSLLSVFLVFRVMLPLPDLVAGGHVAKDLARSWHHVCNSLTRGTSSNSNSGSSNHTNHTRGGKKGSSHARLHPEANNWFTTRWLQFRQYLRAKWCALWLGTSSETANWAERQASMVVENRFPLSMGVVIARMAEYIVVVGIMPRTHLICRATGHCPPGPSLWERSRILYPGGFNEPHRSLGLPVFDYMESDMPSALWTLLGVTIVSAALLLTQTTILNRTYLSIHAFHNAEWQLVFKKNRPSTAKTSSGAGPAPQQSPQVWDATRRYLKGDLVLYPNASSGGTYRAMSNTPSCKPYETSSFGLCDKFVTELGHPGTSVFVAEVATYQVVSALLYFNAWIVLLLLGHRSSTYGLMWAMVAQVVAAQGVLSGATSAAPSGLTRSTFGKPSRAMRSLRALNAEIMK